MCTSQAKVAPKHWTNTSPSSRSYKEIMHRTFTMRSAAGSSATALEAMTNDEVKAWLEEVGCAPVVPLAVKEGWTGHTINDMSGWDIDMIQDLLDQKMGIRAAPIFKWQVDSLLQKLAKERGGKRARSA